MCATRLQEELEARTAAPSLQGQPDDVLVGGGEDAYVGSSTQDALLPLLAHVEGWPLRGGPPRVRALCWLGEDRLLAVQAAWSAWSAGAASGGSSGGSSSSSSGGSGYGGDVLVELQVDWPGGGGGAAADDDEQQQQQQPQQQGAGVRVRVVAAPVNTSPGARVLRVVPHSGEGAACLPQSPAHRRQSMGVPPRVNAWCCGVRPRLLC